jgi:enterochelin esterase-like enzyme
MKNMLAALVFASVWSVGGTATGVFADSAAFAKRVHVLWLGVGTAEPERFRDGIRQLQAGLNEANIQHIYVESEATDHEWRTWRRALQNFAPRLFQDRR